MIESKRTLSLPESLSHETDRFPSIRPTEPDIDSKEAPSNYLFFQLRTIILENTKLPVLEHESKKWDQAKLKEYVTHFKERKEREACALNRLRDLSDDEPNNFGVTQQIKFMDTDFNMAKAVEKQSKFFLIIYLFFLFLGKREQILMGFMKLVIIYRKNKKSDSKYATIKKD